MVSVTSFAEERDSRDSLSKGRAMTGSPESGRGQKRLSGAVTKSILVLLLVLIGRAAGADYTVVLSRIGDSLDGHSTTRTTVRRVFHVNGYWYVFCGDVRNKIYCNFFATSTDGVNWSERQVGSGGGIKPGPFGAPNLPETAIVYGDRAYGCYSEEGEFRIRSGRLSEGDITWTGGHRVAPAYVGKATRNSYGYYPDIMVEESGFISISLRHAHAGETGLNLDLAYVVSARPNDITGWQAPHDLTSLTLPERVDAHESIPLAGGKRVVVCRTTRGVTDKELYKPGWPGSFYALHYDGTKWLEPVDLGNSDGIAGSDKRLSGMLDPGTQVVHLTYIEDSGTHWKNELRYRALSPPYGVDDWSEPRTIATNVFTTALGMDTSSSPARIAAVYGDQLHEGGEVEPTWGSRWHTGKLYLKWFDGTGWEAGRQLISEPDDEYAWFPSVQQDVSGTFGVLYMKGGFANFRKTPKALMFALIKPGD
jgi:hypothetical protein